MTLNFWRMCTANLLLFISVYMLFPLLPFVMGEQLGVSVGQAGSMFLVFVVAMFAVGPFHAYLVDEYKRKHVLLYSALIMLAAVLGYAFVDGYTKFLLLAAVQLRSFGYAWKGIRCCIGKEQNLSFHLIATAVVVIAGFVLGITHMEWMIIILCIGVVIAAELFNTAIEKLVDLVSPQQHPVAGQVKDIAAGAVLVCAATAAIIGLIVFIPYLTCFFL